MSATPRVSVIVPAYNAAGVIEETLHSALAQTFEGLEVLVVDDGSTDETAEIVSRVAERDARVRLIRQENAGVAAARNAAIAAARGAYIAPLDADDIWYPGKLAAQVERMEQGGPRMGMVYTWWVGIDEGSAIRGSSFPCRAEGSVALQLLYCNFIGCASSPLYRREAVERAGGYASSLRDRGAQGCEDWDISLQVAADYEVGVAPGHHVGYRQLPGSMSSDVDTMARSYYAVVDRVRETWAGVPSDVYLWSEANMASYLASQAYSAGKFADAVRWARKALRCDPAFALAPYSYRVLVRSLAHLAGGGALARAFREGQPPLKAFTLEEVDAEWAGTAWVTPWERSGKPYDRIRARRWERLGDAPPPVRSDGSRAGRAPSPFASALSDG